MPMLVISRQMQVYAFTIPVDGAGLSCWNNPLTVFCIMGFAEMKLSHEVRRYVAWSMISGPVVEKAAIHSFKMDWRSFSVKLTIKLFYLLLSICLATPRAKSRI